MINQQRILSSFREVKTISADRFIAICPVCGKEKHLYITFTVDKVLLYCQRCGARARDIISQTDLKMKDLFNNNER